MMVHGKFEEAPANAEPKKRGQTDISEQQAPSARIEATPKKTQPTPAQEKATSPAPTPSPTPANNSLDSLMHPPSSLKLNPPAGTSPAALKPFADRDARDIAATGTSSVAGSISTVTEVEDRRSVQLAL
ncbi:MAG TPA: hypothetical protein VEW05_21140 [Candidatus Polarisedimenticolia bacterium]|nr:hypothetical protein [Candidatus Polarisedimenticolia bacterium]